MRSDIRLKDIRAQFFSNEVVWDGMGMTIAEGDQRVEAVCFQKEERTV